ncbi:MAG TPA: SBBP repeat-containing protein [Candidatus Acidoferrales bacterium]|nr:SBBP repeat-containing protein [Candidatus Acidoferrales bacterium]
MQTLKHVIPAAACVGMAALAIAVLAGGNRGATRLHAARQEPAHQGSREQVLKAYANLPLTFVENRGQTDSRVRYSAQGSGYAFYLTREAVVLSFMRGASAAGLSNGSAKMGAPASLIAARFSAAAEKSARNDEPGVDGAGQAESNGVALALRFLGSNPKVVLEGEERAPGDVNYFRGSDPAQWHTAVPRYAQIVYRQLWPGVDLRLHQQEGTLKYEFVVRPGARPADIRLAYNGAGALTLDSKGGLLVHTALGVLRDSPPVSYQEIAGARVPVESRYALNAADGAAAEYGFAIGAGYQTDRELIIDPGVAYSTFLGGTDVDNGAGIAVDAAGNAYIVGTTQSADFPATVGAFKRTGAVGTFSDVFVAKLNPTGTALVYATFIGGSDFDWGRAIAIDAAGNAYITGQTKSHDFPTTRGAFDPTFNVLNCPRCAIDNYDAFVTKLNPTGSALLYSTFLGGPSDINDALGIAVDAAGSAYVTGETGAADFPVTPGAFRTIRNGAYDAYVTKLNPAGSALVYSTFIGGSAVDFGVRIAVDASNNAYVLGNTASPDFPTTAGAFNTVNNGGFDLFVLKLNAAGSNLIYSTFIGGSGFDSAGGLAIDSVGNAYVSGAGSANYPTTPGVFQPVSQSGTGGVVVSKLDPTGSTLVYSTFLGDYAASGIALTPAGNVWVTGGTSSQSFPTTPDAFQGFFHPGIGSDAFLSELNATGTAILYSTYLGGTNTDGGADVALDAAGNVYVTGETRSTDFPTTANALDGVLKGGQDAFITKLALNGAPPPPPPLPTVAAVSSAQVVGGNSFAITVTLTSGAQGTGAVVALTSSNPAVLTVPANLTIPTGAQNATATATTSVVTATTPVTVTASYNNSSLGATSTVSAPPPPAALSSIGFFPNTVTGGTAALAGLSLTSPAGPGGFTATLSANVPGIVTLPATVTVAQGATSIAFQVPTAAVTTQTGLTVTATAGGVQQLAPLTVNPGAPPALSLSSLAVSPVSVTGGAASQGTVTLTGAAPAGGAVVTLTNNNTSAATVPGSVMVAAGATSATFTVSTVSVTAVTSATVGGAFGGVSHNAVMLISPATATAALSSLAVSPASVAGGAASQGTVTLTGAAPAGGFTATLSSSQAAATVPASVTVAQGATSATFAIATSSVTTSTPVTITASATGSVTRTAALTVTPPAAQGTTLTVTATGRSGQRVTSSPAGINVAVGSSLSAPFATGTAITLSVSGGRTAVWSGACSSGGNDTQTCTFTLTGNATVTANVK